jgi:hypothetical protein
MTTGNFSMRATWLMLDFLLVLILSSSMHHGATAASLSPRVGVPPITVANQKTWTWVGFTNAECANGTATGIGVNFNGASSRVFIYLSAGGACWSYTTCYVTQTAANFTTGYGPANFAADAAPGGFLTQAGSFLDRSSAANPFKDDNFVYVPYCTGDIYAGDNTVAYDASHIARHVGHANMTAFLQRIVATFPAATHVTLAGSSAGGYGALINWDQTQRLFGNTEVDLVDDSGTPIPAAQFPASSAEYQAQLLNWNLAATLPAGCTPCLSQGMSALFAYYAAAYPGDKAAFLTYDSDTVLPSYFNLTAAQWQQVIATDGGIINGIGAFRYFAASGAGHILLYHPLLSANAVSVEQWLTEMLTDSPAWHNVAAP